MSIGEYPIGFLPIASPYSGGVTAYLSGIGFTVALGETTIITVPLAFFDLALSADGAGQYLIEMKMIEAGSARFTSGGAMRSIGELPIAAPSPGDEVDGPEFEEFYSDRQWTGRPDDAVKPNIPYDERIDVPLVIDRNLPLFPEEPRRAARQYGFIQLHNGDGALDDVAAQIAVDGREIRVLYGPYKARYSDFQTIARVLGDQIEASDTAIKVSVRDRALPLDRILQRQTYAGTGGLDGNEELEGKHKPFCVGENPNVTPQMIDSTSLVFQYHRGQAEGVTAVYDRAVELPRDTSVGTGGDVADYDALTGASIDAGKFITCDALGIFRLGSSPAGLITADVKGDKTGGTYVDLLPDVAWRIATLNGDVTAANINRPSFVRLPAYKVGLYISPEEAARKTGTEALGELLGSVGAYWDVSQFGLLRAGKLVDPTTVGAHHVIDAEDIIDLWPEERPRIRWRNPVGYARNWTVQRGEDIGEVTDARKQFLAEAQRVTGSAVESQNILARQPEALNPAVYPSLLREEADAAAVAAEQMSLHGAVRRIFRVDLFRRGYLIDLGEVLSLAWPRHGLQVRRNWLVIGARIDSDRERVRLRIWG